MTTQVQVRGNVQATQEARTLATREIDINTTDSRICIHNGSTAGGIRHVNSFDQQNQEFTYANGSGTNAITITLAVAPTAYQAGQKFTFKAANSITGSATLNVNSLGAKTIKKVSGTSIVNLIADDIIANQTVTVVYDGTDFQLIAGGSGSSIETGSWTPFFADVSVTYTNQQGSYSKIGDLVFCDYRITYSYINTADLSPIKVYGVPFNIIDYTLNGHGFDTSVTKGIRLMAGNTAGTGVISANFYTSDLNRNTASPVRYGDYLNSSSSTFEGSWWYRTT